jgi:hypothetical protein
MNGIEHEVPLGYFMISLYPMIKLLLGGVGAKSRWNWHLLLFLVDLLLKKDLLWKSDC